MRDHNCEDCRRQPAGDCGKHPAPPGQFYGHGEPLKPSGPVVSPSQTPNARVLVSKAVTIGETEIRRLQKHVLTLRLALQRIHPSHPGCLCAHCTALTETAPLEDLTWHTEMCQVLVDSRNP